LGILVVALFSSPAQAEQTVSAVELFDKLRGMWVGQLIGNAAGRATEGVYDGSEPDPRASVPWEIEQVWDADDDTDVEYVALHVLETCGFDCNSDQIAEQWLDHIGPSGIYIANKQAWYLMLNGVLPPETGSRTYNEHWYSIDAQIGTEVLGALSPGLPQTAGDLAGRFGRITNTGFAGHAAKFYASLYARAFFEPNVVDLVEAGLEGLPADSRTREVVSDVLQWYRADAADETLDWRATRRRLYDKYQGAESFGRYYNWVESAINTGATVLALLYGQGDFKRTVQIGVLAGWDCDCNPATAGGLLGIIHGFSGLPADLTDPALCGNLYENVYRAGLPDAAAELPQYEAITTIALRMLILAEENILRNGGSYTSTGLSRLYVIPEPNDAPISIDAQTTIGPTGLVGEALAAGITITPDASVARNDGNYDRHNLAAIMDGIADNSHNGHKPYYTYVPDEEARPEQDWYALLFGAPVRFDAVTFHEGDVLWGKINTYYRHDQARGGWFEDLSAQVLRRGQWLEPADVHISPGLDRFRMYQQITLSFAPTVGEGVRIIGTPGGTDRFTTIMELEAEGQLYEGPHVTDIIIGDGAEPPTDVFYLIIEFDESVTLSDDDIELLHFADTTGTRVAPTITFQTASGRYVLLAFADFLAPGAYELRLTCPAITDDFALPLIDNDPNPNDRTHTTAFTITSATGTR
jgi:ADP-ribosylglycohydrolase